MERVNMQKNRTVLIADDEMEIRNFIRVYLEKDGYEVIEASDGVDTLNQIKAADIVILDIMMPEIDGITVLKKIRKNSNIPVIMLSSKSGNCDRILGLDLGADDYIVKPFDPLELVARVSANLRRFYKLGSEINEQPQSITVNGLTLDTVECVLKKDDEIITLTSVEYRLLNVLMSHPGRVFTKQQLYEAGWEDRAVVDDNSIMVCISKLRNKLNDIGGKYITTIRGLGYRFEK